MRKLSIRGHPVLAAHLSGFKWTNAMARWMGGSALRQVAELPDCPGAISFIHSKPGGTARPDRLSGNGVPQDPHRIVAVGILKLQRGSVLSTGRGYAPAFCRTERRAWQDSGLPGRCEVQPGCDGRESSGDSPVPCGCMARDCQRRMQFLACQVGLTLILTVATWTSLLLPGVLLRSAFTRVAQTFTMPPPTGRLDGSRLQE